MSRPDISTLTENPRAFFAGFDSIVLVANSKDAASALFAPELGDRPLFVFFNRVYRILDEPFRRDRILVTRSTPVGSALVYRKELDDVLSLVGGEGFHGILNLRARDKEVLSKPEDFKGNPVGFLDLNDWLLPIYPRGQRWPSSGFALAMWFARQKLDVPVYLAGFNGVREAQWRIFDAHDWTYEQVLLNVMFKMDRLRMFRVGRYFDAWPVDALTRAFPEIDRNDLSTTAVEVLSHRLNGTNRVIDHVYSSLKPQLAVRDFFRKLRPRSRKAKTRDRLLAEKHKTGDNAA